MQRSWSIGRVDCVYTDTTLKQLGGSTELHDDDNVYHYRPRQHSADRGHVAASKPNRAASSGAGHEFNVDYPGDTGSEDPGVNGSEDPGASGRRFVERASLMMSLGVGAGVLLVALILTTVCAVAVRNRRRRRRKSVDRRSPAQVSDLLVLQIMTISIIIQF